MTGVMASLTAPLKSAKVPVFALSTWWVVYSRLLGWRTDQGVLRTTDYILVPTAMLSDAIMTLERDGWIFPQGMHSRVVRL